MNLSIKAKVAISLTVVLVIVFSTIFIINNKTQSDTVTMLFDDKINSLNWSINKQAEMIMLSGENELLQPLAEEAVANDIAKEITIINSELMIARSSEKSKVNKQTDDKIWETLFSLQKDTIIDTEIDGEPLIISYKLFHNHEDCQDCHDIDDEKILGGLKTVSSKQFVADINQSSITLNMIVFGIGIILLVGIIVIVLKKTIFKPLDAVTTKLELASQGDTNQVIEISSNDEIGRFMKSLQNLFGYIVNFSNASQKIADGDLSVKIIPAGESDVLGHSFKKMVGNLRTIVNNLSGSANELVSASVEITATSEETSQGSKNQTDQVNQIATAINEFSATVSESANHADEANSMAKQANEMATEGGAVVGETIHGMDEMANIVRDSANSIGELAKSTDQIGEIISVIDEIADQTNLLA
ncbi:MAG: methyl-accepting chemotaxis protein, partial [candidate division Zixibacteria bacterium]|nr:methyl-accepting chemotaxis protein [candidate division Zixibacteria bacterium]